MDVKVLKLLKLVAILIVIFLAGVLVFIYNKIPKEEVLNLGKIRNNESSLIAYGDEKFYFSSELSGETPIFKFLNKNEKTGTSKVIKNFANMYPYSGILAEENKLYYCKGGNTYIYDIEKNKEEMFAKGDMQYLANNWYVALDDGILYKGIYYRDTFKTVRISPIVSDGTVTYAYEDENELYYIAKTSNNYHALLGLNKLDLTVSVYDKIDGEQQRILKVSSNNNYIFELIEYIKNDEEYFVRIIPKAEKNNKNEFKLEKSETFSGETITYSYIFLDKESVNEPYEFDENIYMLAFKDGTTMANQQAGYLIYDINEGELKLQQPTLTETTLYQYSATIKGAQIVLYKNGKEYKKVPFAGQIERELEIMDVYHFDDEEYYKLLLNKNKKIFIYVKVDKEGNAEIYQ